MVNFRNNAVYGHDKLYFTHLFIYVLYSTPSSSPKAMFS